jgi:hypothetical protein
MFLSLVSSCTTFDKKTEIMWFGWQRLFVSGTVFVLLYCFYDSVSIVGHFYICCNFCTVRTTVQIPNPRFLFSLS